MSRPFKCRRVGCKPQADYFKPRGIPVSFLDEISLSIDEFEALRLADLEGLYQEEAAERMKVSRQTFGNIIASAHKKVAEAIVKAKALKIEGGVYTMIGMRRFKCYGCNHEWEIAYGLGRPSECPQCKNTNIHRTETDRGYARSGKGGGFGHGCRRS